MTFVCCPGDLFLLNNRSSILNRLGQTVRRGKKSNFSHVALCVGPKTFIHATPPYLTTITRDEILKKYSNGVLIRNNKIFERCIDNHIALIKNCAYRLFLPYPEELNIILNVDLTKKPICSTFINDVFYESSVSQRDKAFALPVDFENYIIKDDWFDVGLVNSGENVSNIIKLADEICLSQMFEVAFAKHVSCVFNELKKFFDEILKSVDCVEKIERECGSFPDEVYPAQLKDKYKEKFEYNWKFEQTLKLYEKYFEGKMQLRDQRRGRSPA